MTSTRNLGRVAGLWYLFLSVPAPLRLIYIPSKLFAITLWLAIQGAKPQPLRPAASLSAVG